MAQAVPTVTEGPANPWLQGDVRRGADYASRFDELAASGVHVHGEAGLVESLGPRTVLDAGCGTGESLAELGTRQPCGFH